MRNLVGLQFNNPYDSHVHWEATGAFINDLNLSHLISPEQILNVRKPIRNGWVLGYHWDDTHWANPPSINLLDQWAPNDCVFLQRVDRHSAWVNTKTLQTAGLWRKHSTQPFEGGRISLNSEGWPTGLVLDKTMEHIQKLIPPITLEETFSNLKQGVKIFNSAGFTHIRDLSCTPLQFEAALKLRDQGLLTLAVEQYFDVRGESIVTETIRDALAAKKDSPSLIRVQGIKMYYDGALGSEGALISRPYYGCGSNVGFRLYEPKDLADMIAETWSHGLRAAVHVIGDEAADQVVDVAVKLNQRGHLGILELEHAEMLRDETIAKMKNLNVICHMQPCHWLSDKKWTHQKLGPLTKYLFRWNDLEKNKTPIFFGSDAPIEPASLFRNLEALYDAANTNIPLPECELKKFFEHPDPLWVPGCQCELGEKQVRWTRFAATAIFQS